jgi:hypothetical protein
LPPFLPQKAKMLLFEFTSRYDTSKKTGQNNQYNKKIFKLRA